MVRQAEIPIEFARGKVFARPVESRDFPRFAQGPGDCVLRIGDWGFAAGSVGNVKRSQFAAGPIWANIPRDEAL